MCLPPAVDTARHHSESATCTVIDLPGRSLVLLAEDNDCVAALVTRILARLGLGVLRANCGAECERLFAEHESEIALVMLDCRLPDGDGAMLAGRLRQCAPELPVLLTSGRENREAKALVAQGNAAFLPKPFFPAQVAERVSALLGAIA